MLSLRMKAVPIKPELRHFYGWEWRKITRPRILRRAHDTFAFDLGNWFPIAEKPVSYVSIDYLCKLFLQPHAAAACGKKLQA